MTRALLLLLAPLLLGACSVRETTTPRTATEVLLISTAAERAVGRFDASPLKGKRVAIDDSRYDAVDKPYVISALRTQVVRCGARLVKDLRQTKPDAPAPEAIVELRNASLGIWDGNHTLGIPPLPVSRGAGQEPLLLPGFYLLRRSSQQAYCKLQLFTYDVATKRPLLRADALWGYAYYNVWWVLGFGPFTGSEDIYPEEPDEETQE